MRRTFDEEEHCLTSLYFLLQQVQSQPEDQPGGPSQPLPQPSQSLLGQPLAPVPEEGAECLKCNTFAELQERLDCIDGSEEVMRVLCPSFAVVII